MLADDGTPLAPGIQSDCSEGVDLCRYYWYESGTSYAAPQVAAAAAGVVEKSLQYADDVLVVDDGSKDNTSEIAKNAGASIIKHPTNFGKGVALKDAFNNVDGYDVVVTIDGDGQHNPEEIPDLIKPILEGRADFVNGSRYIDGFEENTPAYRRGICNTGYHL